MQRTLRRRKPNCRTPNVRSSSVGKRRPEAEPKKIENPKEKEKRNPSHCSSTTPKLRTQKMSDIENAENAELFDTKSKRTGVEDERTNTKIKTLKEKKPKKQTSYTIPGRSRLFGRYILARVPPGGIETPSLILTLFARGPSSPRKSRHCSPSNDKHREFFWDTLFHPPTQ